MWTKDSLLGVPSGKSCTLATSISTVEIFCSRCPLGSRAKMDIVLVKLMWTSGSIALFNTILVQKYHAVYFFLNMRKGFNSLTIL